MLMTHEDHFKQMDGEELWDKLHDLFDTDDGSLPEIRITNLSRDGAVAAFSYFQQFCSSIANDSSFWSIEEQQDKPINSVPNAAARVVQGRAEPFHFLCSGLTYDGQEIPPIGVFVFSDEIYLNYRMGHEWDPPKLKALFGVLMELKRINPEANVGLEHYAMQKVRKHFETTWEAFLSGSD